MSTKLSQYTWIVAVISICFCLSSFGNGANDVSNSYANTVASRTLSMPQVGMLAMLTEFTGAVAMGHRVTHTIKNGILEVSHFANRPAAFMVAMASAELGSAAWLLLATRFAFPVSTTQTVVGAIIGAGVASGAKVRWGWEKNSFSQIALTWVVSPLIAAAISAALFATMKYCILERRDPLTNAFRAVPYYLAFTAAVLALFLVVECPTFSNLEDLGAPRACAIILGTFFGMLATSYAFFIPYFKRIIIKKDSRVRFYHLPLGPWLSKENPPLYWPGPADEPVVIDYYSSNHVEAALPSAPLVLQVSDTEKSSSSSKSKDDTMASSPSSSPSTPSASSPVIIVPPRVSSIRTPEERFLHPTRNLPKYDASRILSYMKYFFLKGVTTDVVHHSSELIKRTHANTIKYDNNVEFMWTYAQVASCMIMSIAHGSNDVSNAIGPWVAVYNTWKSGNIDSQDSTPIFILVVAGLLLGLGFWFSGYKIMRAMGNHVTQLSPVRGFCVELATAITVLMSSRLGIPISTTQTLTGALVGVGLMNMKCRAVNWRQIGKICCGWVLTLPAAGLIAGLVCAAMLHSPEL